MDQVYRNLKKARQEKGLTLEQVAERIGMTKAGYHAIERGINDVGIRKLEKIAGALGVSVEELLGVGQALERAQRANVWLAEELAEYKGRDAVWEMFYQDYLLAYDKLETVSQFLAHYQGTAPVQAGALYAEFRSWMAGRLELQAKSTQGGGNGQPNRKLFEAEMLEKARAALDAQSSLAGWVLSSLANISRFNRPLTEYGDREAYPHMKQVYENAVLQVQKKLKEITGG